MDATDRLCRMLEERGVEYETDVLPNGKCGVSWIDGNDIEWEAIQRGENFEIHALQLVTPEQAIAATVGRCDTMGLWHEWEQVLFANVSDEVAQDNLNECVHELLDKAATIGERNPDGLPIGLTVSNDGNLLNWVGENYVRQDAATVGRGNLTAEQVREAIMSADRWRKPMGDTGMTNTHLIIRDDGWQAIADELNATVGAGTCRYIPDDAGFMWWDENDVEHYEEHSASDECCFASCDKCGNQMMVGDDGWFNGWDEITDWWEEDGSYHKGYVLEPRFKHCPNCGRRIVKEEAE